MLGRLGRALQSKYFWLLVILIIIEEVTLFIPVIGLLLMSGILIPDLGVSVLRVIQKFNAEVLDISRDSEE